MTILETISPEDIIKDYLTFKTNKNSKSNEKLSITKKEGNLNLQNENEDKNLNFEIERNNPNNLNPASEQDLWTEKNNISNRGLNLKDKNMINILKDNLENLDKEKNV